MRWCSVPARSGCSTYLLRPPGWTWTAARSPADDPRPRLAAASERATSRRRQSPRPLREEVGGFDLVVEATGDAQVMADSLGPLGRNGVACLLGLAACRRAVELDGRVLGVDAIVENRTVFGSVNAHRTDWLAAVESLERAHERWPDALRELRACAFLDRFAEAFDHLGVKATLVLGD